jgi:hypothetical protein
VNGDNRLARQPDLVVMIGKMPCKLPWDDQLRRLETQGEGQEVRWDGNGIGTKRTRIMSASNREIVGPRFSSLTKVVAREVRCGEGESSWERSESKDKESGQLAGVPEVQMHGGKQSGQGVKTTLPGTAPAPRWCPPRLTKTQCRCIQKLRAREIE